ncbi:MAG: hypothetical protein H8D23_30600 [Candidatus Brocadiales bacterium]|nr:hypothetical protein [Candidatus Brocadiales bacterium]
MPKVFQMKQYKLVEGKYVEIGLWTMPADRMGLEIEIDDVYEEEHEEANWILNRLVGSYPLPEDFLEYHQEQKNGYDGMMGKIVKSDK